MLPLLLHNFLLLLLPPLETEATGGWVLGEADLCICSFFFFYADGGCLAAVLPFAPFFHCLYPWAQHQCAPASCPQRGGCNPTALLYHLLGLLQLLDWFCSSLLCPPCRRASPAHFYSPPSDDSVCGHSDISY